LQRCTETGLFLPHFTPRTGSADRFRILNLIIIITHQESFFNSFKNENAVSGCEAMLLPMPELKRPTYDRLVVNTAKYVSQKVLLTFWDLAYIGKNGFCDVCSRFPDYEVDRLRKQRKTESKKL